MKSSIRDTGNIEQRESVISNVEDRDKKHRKNRKNSPVKNAIIRILLFLATLLTLFVVIFTVFYWFYHPGLEWTDKNQGSVVFNDIAFDEEDYVILDDSLYLEFDVVKSFIDTSIFYDSADSRVVVTTADKIIDMDTKLLTININYQPVLIDTPILMENDTPYVSMDFLSPIYNLKIEYLDSGFIVLDDFSKSVLSGTVSKSISLFPDIFLMADAYLNEGVFLREEPLYPFLRIKELMES